LGELETSAVTVTLAGLASQPDVAALGEPESGLGVSRAYVSASSLSLVPCRSSAAELVLPSRGYELVQTPPPREYVTTAVTELCGLRLEVEPLGETAGAGVPEGASLYVEGQDAMGDSFSLASDASLSLLFEATEAASFGDLPLLLGFDVSTWLAGLPVPEDMAAEQRQAFEAQLLDAAALYVDANENGALDDDEAMPVASAAAAR
jgi:hypothetical protein